MLCGGHEALTPRPPPASAMAPEIARIQSVADSLAHLAMLQEATVVKQGWLLKRGPFALRATQPGVARVDLFVRVCAATCVWMYVDLGDDGGVRRFHPYPRSSS